MNQKEYLQNSLDDFRHALKSVRNRREICDELAKFYLSSILALKRTAHKERIELK